ncbi:MAG: D-alanyl-D-alanine carboxypeptidase/D-alanyl-D-alanine-endopeptidase [Legionellaceae bacterium]|nr:D-alanyl-D-alanine carboxypeptidase/D-alanyl-D-alanine-endopeptidase [Legionellaceae bacterium]
MNKRILSCLAAVFLLPVSAYASISALDRLIHRVDPKINLGIQVVDLHSHTILYQRNAEKLFVPASNMKLFSDAAALLWLGPDYQFHNQLSLQALFIKDNRLQGHLILHLPGDPSFDQQQLRHLFQSIAGHALTTIEGDILIDSQLATLTAHPPGGMEEDLDYGYGAPLAPLMLDQNRVRVTVNPAGRAGQAAIIEDNTPYGLSIINHVTTAKKGQHCRLAFKMDTTNTLTVKGCVAQGQWAVVQQLALQNPLQHAQKSIRQLLKQQNITLNGRIRLAKSQQPSLLLSSSHSPKLSQLIAETMKSSDNLYADALFLHTAAQMHNKALDWPEAQAAIKQFLHQQVGLDLASAHLTDGSGLSRHNRLSPAQTVTLLRFLHQHFALTYEYVSALPVAGRDGTLQKRLRLPRQMDRVRAKTGTMRGVVSLSGYMDTENGHTLAFAMYINQQPGTHFKPARRYRYLIDAICQYFLQQSPTQAPPVVQVLQQSPLRFQGQKSQAEQQRQQTARWRRLETQVKKFSQQQQLTILFRPHELIIQDHQAPLEQVLDALQRLHQRYPFAVILQSATAPIPKTGFPLLWQQTPGESTTTRTWILRPIV